MKNLFYPRSTRRNAKKIKKTPEWFSFASFADRFFVFGTID